MKFGFPLAAGEWQRLAFRLVFTTAHGPLFDMLVFLDNYLMVLSNMAVYFATKWSRSFSPEGVAQSQMYIYPIFIRACANVYDPDTSHLEPTTFQTYCLNTTAEWLRISVVELPSPTAPGKTPCP